MIRIPSHRVPTHPGEMLLEEFLKPMELTQRQLADAIGVPYQRVNEIVNGRRGVTPSTALRLARFFGTSADFWLNLQMRWDLYFTQQTEADQIEAIKVHVVTNGKLSTLCPTPTPLILLTRLSQQLNDDQKKVWRLTISTKNLLTTIFCVIVITACTPIPNNGGGNEVRMDDTSIPKTEVTLTPIDKEAELTELMGTSWMLEDIGGNPPIDETLISLQINPKHFSGSAGCNRYSAKYTAESLNCFSVDVIEINLEACTEPEGILEQEKYYTKLLFSAKMYQLENQELHLLDEQGTIILRFQPRQKFDVSPETLINKTWRLTSAHDLDTDYLNEFTLSFGEISFGGTTVCRDYEGRYQAEDDTFQITFMSMTTEYNCSKQDGHAEAQYTTLLSNVEQYNITSDQLELFTRHGEKLVFELVSK